MTLVIDTNDGLDGVITLANPISGTWELKSSYCSHYMPDAVDPDTHEFIFDLDGTETTVQLTSQTDLSLAQVATDLASISTLVIIANEDDRTLRITASAPLTIKWTESSASVLFTNSGQDRSFETGETFTLHMRDRSALSHYKFYIEESWKNNVTTSGESPTFIVPVENLVEIPGQTMELAQSTTTITWSVREYGGSENLDFDTGPTITLVLNQV